VSDAYKEALNAMTRVLPRAQCCNRMSEKVLGAVECQTDE
jgi:hypothetical protein